MKEKIFLEQPLNYTVVLSPPSAAALCTFPFCSVHSHPSPPPPPVSCSTPPPSPPPPPPPFSDKVQFIALAFLSHSTAAPAYLGFIASSSTLSIAISVFYIFNCNCIQFHLFYCSQMYVHVLSPPAPPACPAVYQIAARASRVWSPDDSTGSESRNHPRLAKSSF